MSGAVECPNCRKMMPGMGALFAGNFTLTNVAIRCPYCGHSEPLPDGSYSIVDGVVAAFIAPGMTREKLEAARGVAKKAAAGTLASDEALQRLEAISDQLAEAVRVANRLKIDWGTILALFMAIYSIWTDWQSDAVAQAALAEAQKSNEVSQRMLEELQAQNESLRELATKPESQPPAQAQTNAPRNRAEKRKAAALERRTKSRGE